MARGGRPGVALAMTMAVAVLALALAGCGGGDDEGAATTATAPPAAGGAALSVRVLGADELGIPGLASQGQLQEVSTIDDVVDDDDCAPTREAARLVLEDAGFEAAVRRAWAGDERGAISVVNQFATPEGAKAWGEEVLSMDGDTPAQCLPEGVTVTPPTHTSIPEPPGATLTRSTRTTPDGPFEAYNVVFQDGRYLYVTGAAGPPGAIDPDVLVAAATAQWERRGG